MAAGIPVIQPEKMKDPGVFEQLKDWAPDVIVVMAFGKILRKNVLELPHLGCINVHASLLPRWRGASPIQAAILAGDELTGVSIMKMDAGMDTGPVYATAQCEIGPQETTLSLSEKLAGLGAKTLMKTLPAIVSGDLQPQPQPETGVTIAPLIQKDDGRLDFSLPAIELERKVRAFNPWPSAYFYHHDVMIKVIRAHAVADCSLDSGVCLIERGAPAIAAGEGMLILDEIQCAGKKAMAGNAFLAGCRIWEDEAAI
jgi:methionyl-tRNA formyltransferase